MWGAAAQHRLQNSKVLVCGLSGNHVELVKNIVLTGVNVQILDDGVVGLDDLHYNYFVTKEDIGCSVIIITCFHK